MEIEAGRRVRLKANPGKIGVIKGNKRLLANNTHWQVDFLSAMEWHIEDHLELVPETQSEHPLDLFRNGRFGNASDLRGNLTHKRLSGRLANLIYSMDTTHTDFHAYQFKPIIKFLNSPSNGLLIADEVGLGKTIEAGLIWTELRSRFDIRRVMVLCLAVLREKWSTELRKRFGIDAKIMNADEALKTFEQYKSGEEIDYAMICSMQGLRPKKNWKDEELQDSSSRLARFLDQYQEPLLDLLIIDEAHYLRNQGTMTAKMGRLLRSVSSHILLLSATPIHLHNEDLYQLLNMVDENTFNDANKGIFNEMLIANAPLIKLRDEVLSGNMDQKTFLERLRNIGEHRFFDNNQQIKHLEINPPTDLDLKDYDARILVASRLDNMNLLGSVINRTRKKEAITSPVKRDAIAEMINMSDPELSFYNKATRLIREYAMKKGGNEGFYLSMTQRQITSSMPAAIKGWIEKNNEEPANLFEDIGAIDFDADKNDWSDLKKQLISDAAELGDYDELYNNDSKYFRLVKMIEKYFRDSEKGDFKKVVLFSFFRGTLKYLSERLEKDGVKNIILMGGMDDKQSIIDQFRMLENNCILLCSEVASEGVDLQFCKLLINYDLPWNPMRVEQRIGRLDRIGQESPFITIWNMFYSNTIDARIYYKLYERLNIFESALGGLEPIIGNEIRKLTASLLLRELTPEEQEKRIEETEIALASRRKHEEDLESEAAILMAHEQYIINKIHAVKEFHRNISKEDLLNYITDFLTFKYPGTEIQQVPGEKYIFDIKLSNPTKLNFERFLTDKKLLAKTRLHKDSLRAVRCKFENQVDDLKSGWTEIISQFHPIIRFASHEIDSGDDYRHYSPVSVLLKKGYAESFLEGVYVFHIAQWSISGMRDIERLHFTVIPIENGNLLDNDQAEKLVTISAKFGENWQGVENVVDLDDASKLAECCISNSLIEYNNFLKQVKRENNDRADIQERSIREHQELQIRNLREQYENQFHKPKIARMTLGRINALEGRLGRKMMEIQNRRNIHSNPLDMCLGLIKIVA